MLILHSSLQNGVVIKTYTARLSLPASCVSYVTRQVCLKINTLSHARVGNTENIACLHPISNSAFGWVGYGTQKRYIFPCSTRACVITYYVNRIVLISTGITLYNVTDTKKNNSKVISFLFFTGHAGKAVLYTKNWGMTSEGWSPCVVGEGEWSYLLMGHQARRMSL